MISIHVAPLLKRRQDLPGGGHLLRGVEYRVQGGMNTSPGEQS